MVNIFHNICNKVTLGIFVSNYRMILTHFVRVCSVLVDQILTFDLIEEAAKRLIKIIKLIEEHYGHDSIFRSIYKNVRTILAFYTHSGASHLSV